jgi:hypothetical protein
MGERGDDESGQPHCRPQYFLSLVQGRSPGSQIGYKCQENHLPMIAHSGMSISHICLPLRGQHRYWVLRLTCFPFNQMKDHLAP